MRRVPVIGGSYRPLRALLDQFFVDRIARRLGADVVHHPSTVGPLFPGLPTVVTVHFNVDPLHARSMSFAKRTYLALGFRRSLSAATRLIVPSASIRDALVHDWGVSPEKVDVVWHGVARPSPVDMAAASALLERLSVRGPFFLTVTNGLPHKGLQVTLGAYQRASRFLPTLVVVGVARETVAKMPGVRAAGWQPNGTILALCSRARATISSAFTESFGMSAAESLAMGTPVIVTAIAAHREIVGEAGLLVPPGDVDALAQALIELASDERAYRLLREAAIDRGELFDWKRTAAGSAASYRRALHG